VRAGKAGQLVGRARCAPAWLTRARERAANTLVLAFFLSLALGLLFLALLRRNAPLCVRVACAVQVAIPLVLAVSSLAAGAVGAGLLMLACGALAAFCFYLWRRELALCGQLLTVAVAALNENAHLVSASLGLTVVACATVAPLAGLMAAASRVGSPVPAADAVALADQLTCSDAQGNPAACCVWGPAPGAVLYQVYAALVTCWAVALAFEVRLFTIAHVVSRWYETPRGVALSGSPVREAAALAVGASLGSLCLGSAILTAADVARQASQSASRRGGGLIACLLASVVACVAELLKLLTRFATVRAAVTGEAFMCAARSVTELLQRNALSAYAVWRFPPMVLTFTALAFAAAGAALAMLGFSTAGAKVVAAAGAPGSAAAGDASATLALLTVAVGAGALCLALVTLLFLASIVINVVDVIYICWATDLDRQCVARPEVHAVFAAVPSVRVTGALVQQPDGELGYAPGAATHAQQQQRQGVYAAPAAPAAQ
jgi:hypothetical protein